MRLVALHGFSLHGALMRRQLGFLRDVDVIAPDAPHVCPEDAVARLHAVWDVPRQPGPHLYWWDASDDGREYRGWEATLATMRDVLAPLAGDRIGLIGFSQGAILATAITALSARGELPAIDRAILVAGRPPRADVLLPYLTAPLETRSLHIWGESDDLVGSTPAALAELFAPSTRSVVTWPGGHTIPTDGPAADAIAEFIAAG